MTVAQHFDDCPFTRKKLLIRSLLLAFSISLLFSKCHCGCNLKGFPNLCLRIFKTTEKSVVVPDNIEIRGQGYSFISSKDDLESEFAFFRDSWFLKDGMVCIDIGSGTYVITTRYKSLLSREKFFVPKSRPSVCAGGSHVFEIHLR